MLRKFFRELGFRCLSLYAVMEESHIEKLIKQGYMIADEGPHRERLDVVHKVLKKLRNEGY
nr:MAG TPA: hypothetical protein [Caudoviricetes sp.]